MVESGLNRFCIHCGAERQPGGRFCGSCGTSFEDGSEIPETVRPATSPTPAAYTYDELVGLARDPDLDEDTIDDLLAGHAACFDAELCDLCESSDDEGEGLLVALAGNPALSPEQQDTALEAAMSWQGRVVMVLMAFAANPNVSERVKGSVAVAPDFVVSHVGPDLDDIAEMIQASMERNPRFSLEDMESFSSSWEQYR